MVSDSPGPLVSVGMPVYNGAKSIRRAIESLLTQDYSNFELIISDNASTDQTPDICKYYASRDERIRYYAAEQNMGSVWNYNRVFELSKGKYFLWAADDDFREPYFISKCVQILEENPEAVLCHSYVVVCVGTKNNMMHICTQDSIEGIRNTVKRYIEAYKNLPSTSIYGLIRSDVLRKTGLFQNHLSNDVALTKELTLYGEFCQVKEKMFWYIARPTRRTPSEEYAILKTGNKLSGYHLPFLMLAVNHLRRVLRVPLPFFVKVFLCFCIIGQELKIIAVKAIFRLTAKSGVERVALLGKSFAKRFLYYNPNIRIVSHDLYNKHHNLP